ncbi:MAG TPA: aminotransferase class IV [Planctomycetota bacterium]|jgi:branched-subunit amino acid aminotransferase/4-amino-4-deoxychorismate lyase|nr:aminotransferase class IV [Planctomycetota bacterium]
MSAPADGFELAEVVRVRRGRFARLDAHVRRMAASARALGFVAPTPTGAGADLEATLARCVRELVEAHRIREALVELRLARRSGATPPAPRAALVTGDPFLEPFGPDALAAGLRLIVASAPRDEHDLRARHKTSDRAAARAARDEARAAGADEALLLNRQGRVAGAAAENLFVLDDAGLRTPPIEEGALPGVTRAALLAAARSLGVPVREVPLTVGDLLAAPDLLLTASAHGLLSVRSLLGRDLAPPRAGSRFRGLVPRLRLRLHELGE